MLVTCKVEFVGHWHPGREKPNSACQVKKDHVISGESDLGNLSNAYVVKVINMLNCAAAATPAICLPELLLS